MKLKELNILGTMSGTSLDGIDLSLCKTNGVSLKRSKLNYFQEFDKKTREKLNLLINNFSAYKNDLKFQKQVENLITSKYIEAIKKVQNFHDFDLIGFHGQTIFHDPKNKCSIQLGDAKRISNYFKKTIIYDFRSADISNGGHGAPIAPIYHKHLMEKYSLKLPACFINVGGISNVTYWDGKELIGFDTGPGNLLMDKFMQSKRNKNYDYKGHLASKGIANNEIINLLLQRPFYSRQYPKSLDKNEFKEEWKSIINLPVKDSDKMATFLKLTVLSIKKSLTLLPKYPCFCLITGGGFFNFELRKKLFQELNINTKFNLWNTKINKFLEAELISYLAARKIYNLPSSFKKTTGTNFPTVLGKIYDPIKIL